MVAILLSRVKIEFGALRQAILGVNEAVVTPQLVKQLLKFVPTAEEVGALASYRSDPPANLARTDRFLLEMLKIERYEARLKALEFKQCFSERLGDCTNDLEVLRLACDTLSGSEEFQAILDMVLMLGNVMNAGSYRGGAFGYRISSINRVAFIYSID